MRNVMKFDTKWAFTKDFTDIPSELPEKWVWVNLPHTWNAIDGQDGGGDYYRGTCCYANVFKKSDMTEGKDDTGVRYFLELRGANSSADVYVNGVKLAHHDGGYSTWRVDMTDNLKEENLIVVTVDNAANDKVYPQVADFTFYGGLYRDVNIIAVPESHFDLEYYGSPAIKVLPVKGEKGWTVEIEGYVTGAKAGQKLVTTVKKPCGCVVETVTNDVADNKAVIDLGDAHLWNGRKDPYLYTASIDLVEGDEVLDSVSTRFGCRTYEIDPNEGFILNGESYPLRGVSRHQDRWGVGNALLPEHHEEDIDLIMEGGFTTIRLALYQHDQYFYDLCDEKGLVIWAEIPYISNHMPTGRENTISQMKELVYQNFNHPCIVVWGLSNEITMKGADDPDLVENHVILNDLVHELDPSRKTTMAVVSTCPIDAPYISIPDCLSYNHYFGWYGGDTSMNGPWMDNFHAVHPDIPLGMSEYGCEALNWHTSDPQQGDYTEEYQAYYHEELIKQLYTRKYIWATHVWNMFDFGCDGRNEGGENGQNHKGLITIDRKYKKDSFYAYKAWLSDEPFVHIAGKRYVDRVEDVTKVTVYSNQPEVSLYVNGQLLETKSAEDHFFKFDVPNVGKSTLTAVAGDLKDESIINKVDVFNEDYRLKEKGAVLNWFDITMPEGKLNLTNKISDMVKNPAALSVIMEAMGPSMDSMGGASEDNPMMQMMGSFTLLRLLSMMGVMGKQYTKEELLAINEKLNQLDKM